MSILFQFGRIGILSGNLRDKTIADKSYIIVHPQNYCRYRLLIDLDVTNHNLIKVPKEMLSQRIKKRGFKTLGTGVIYNPLSLPSLDIVISRKCISVTKSIVLPARSRIYNFYFSKGFLNAAPYNLNIFHILHLFFCDVSLDHLLYNSLACVSVCIWDESSTRY